MRYEFRYLDPTRVSDGCAAYPRLKKAHRHAALWFGTKLRFTDDSAELMYRPASVVDVQDAIDAAVSFIYGDLGAVTSEEVADEIGIGQRLLARLKTTGGLVQRVRLVAPNGVSFRPGQAIAAVALMQCDRVIAAVKASEIDAVVSLMWDLSCLTAVLRKPIDAWEVAVHAHRASLSEGGTRAADASHAEHRDMRAAVLEHYRQHGAKYKTKNEAAEDMARTLVPMRYETVRRWLRGA